MKEPTLDRSHAGMVTINENRMHILKKSAINASASTMPYFSCDGSGFVEISQYDCGPSSIVLRQLTMNGIMDHFTALALIKARLAKVPLTSSWQLI